MSINLLYNKKSWEKNIIYYKYNHLLEQFNIIKVNLKVKNILAAEMAKICCYSNINRNIKDVK